MKVSLSFEKTITEDTSIMVDALRASTTITLALNNFEEIIPCFSVEEAIELGERYNSVIAGERSGRKIPEFDVGNSPREVERFKIPEGKSKALILTTSNGTRILEGMSSKVLIGSMLNSKAAAEKAIELCEEEIDVVMAGYRGQFALEDFLVGGEIVYWIYRLSDGNCELTDFAKAGMLATRDYGELCKGVYNSNSARKLEKMGNRKDVECCLLRNITSNVGIYEGGKIKLL